MTEDYWKAFFTLHRGLPREGPGEPSDVAWAAKVAGLSADARILDAACGPGADIAALRAVASQGHVRAVEKVSHFVEEARARTAGDAGVEVIEGDMMAQSGPFDFIWCAGAIYFVGVTQALQAWRGCLAPGGRVAFSQVCWLTDGPPSRAKAFWADYADMTDEAGVRARIADAGYEILAERRLSDAAWEAYYGPLDRAIATLRPEADEALAAVLDEAEEEAAVWWEARGSFGYTHFVTAPG